MQIENQCVARALLVAMVACVLAYVVGCGRVDNTTAPVGDLTNVDKWCPTYTVTYKDPNTTDIYTYHPAAGGIKDFSLIESAGIVHLFHITDPGTGWPNGGETTFGHATSANLRIWTTLDRIDLTTSPGTWSDKCTWAPHVIEFEGTYYMFYTGVHWSGTDPRSDHWQRIGLATSTDLETWTRYDGEGQDGLILDAPDSTLFAWSAYYDGDGMHDLRDPFVYHDVDQYVMFVSTSVTVDSNTKVTVAYATSTDLLHWTWVNYVSATFQPGSPKAESPCVVKNGDYYFLMWTYRDDALPSGGVRIAYALDVEGPYTYMSSASPPFRPRV